MYTDFKYAMSDAVCSVLSPVTAEPMETFCGRYIDGFIVTLELLIASCLVGFVLAVGLAISRLGNIRLLRWLANTFVYIFRGTPLLVQLWIFYFGIGGLSKEALGLFWPFFSSAWTVGFLVLAFNNGAYVSEILRGGITNVERGSVEAATAIGLSSIQVFWRIELPQALKSSWPAYGNELILMLKGSALVSTITVMDLMGHTRTIFARNYDLNTYFFAAVLYLALAGMLSCFVYVVERRLRRPYL